MDDPELLLLGATGTNELNAVIVLIAWMAMGFKLAFHSASWAEEGQYSTWTSSRKCVAMVFLNGEGGTLRREFTLASYLGADVDVLVQIDASPWGLRGALFEAGRAQ